MPNGNKWDKYVVQDSTAAPNKWDQYAAPATPQVPAQAPQQQLQQPSIAEQVSAPGRTAQTAAESFRRGDIPAGIFQGANAGMQAAMTPLTAAMSGYRQLGAPGQFAMDGLEGIMGAVPNGLNYLSSLINRGLKGVGVPDNILNLGMSPQANQAGSELLTNVGSAVLIPEIAKGVAPIARGALDNMAKASEARQITKGVNEFQSAVPPPTAAGAAQVAKNWGEKIGTAAKYIADEARARQAESGQIFEKGAKNAVGQPVHVAEQSLDLGLAAERKLYQKMTAPVNEIGDQMVNPSAAVAKTLESIPENTKLLHPEVAEAAKKAFATYQQDIPVRVLNKEITTLNAEEANFRKANPGVQADMLQKDPSLQLRVELAKNLRQMLFDKLEENGYTGIKEMRKDYGTLSDVNDRQAALLQRNLAKDQRGVFNSGFGSPIRKGLWAGVISKLVGASAPLAGAVDIGVTGAEAIRASRGKPSAQLGRATERFAKSGLTGRQVGFTPPNVSPVGETTQPNTPLTVGGMTPEELEKAKELYPRFKARMRPDQSQVPPELQKIGVTFDGVNSEGQENYTDRSAGGSTFTRLPTESIKEALLRHRKNFYGR